MAELENNLESIEEVKQPHDGAEKGDTKPVKQGSSDAESIESGKVEVVKPEENPVDKAVASVKAAEKAPSNEGDAQKKGADKPEKMEKIKEGEEDSKKDVATTSKMENIKAIVNNMKEMTKEELQKTFIDYQEKIITLKKKYMPNESIEGFHNFYLQNRAEYLSNKKYRFSASGNPCQEAYEEALPLLHNLDTIYPKEPYPKDLLGKIYYNLDSLDLSESYFNKVRRLDREYFKALTYLGHISLKQKKYRKAMLNYTMATYVGKERRDEEHRVPGETKVNIDT